MTKTKSPIKKISHAASAASRQGSKFASVAATRGSQIIDQASAVVQSGTKLSSAVVSSASDAISSSPSKQMSPSFQSSTNGGIRDRINIFNSVSNQRSHHGQQSTQVCSDDKPSPAVATRNKNRRRGKLHTPDVFAPSSDFETHDKENEIPNLEQNETNMSKRYTGNVKQSIRQSPLKHKTEDENSRLPLPSTNRDPTREEILEMQLKELEKENEKLLGRNKLLEAKYKQVIQKNEKLEAMLQNSDGNQSTGTTKYHRTVKDGENGNKTTKEKRSVDEHPLILSPLRKHMRAVYESSEMNSVVSVRKEPFPLFLPPDQPPQSEFEDPYGTNGIECQGMASHLDMLATLTCTTKSDDSKYKTRSIAKGRNKEADKSKQNAKEKQAEDALNLLNSAAFLFSNGSRRDVCRSG